MTEKERKIFYLKQRLFEIMPANQKKLKRVIANLKYTDNEIKCLIRVFEK